MNKSQIELPFSFSAFYYHYYVCNIWRMKTVIAIDVIYSIFLTCMSYINIFLSPLYYSNQTASGLLVHKLESKVALSSWLQCRDEPHGGSLPSSLQCWVWHCHSLKVTVTSHQWSFDCQTVISITYVYTVCLHISRNVPLR